ncbi:hypothetical protein [Corynebacterium halotolerans]|uniref:hypothetical protein n=1 Tax=Corynebacterium halotolerans TaxID=225326 RepID=UPI000A698D19|nr:hypothetical protein [Corynebacterium halotolerans]
MTTATIAPSAPPAVPAAPAAPTVPPLPEAPPLEARGLLPALRPLDWVGARGLSDDGFCDSAAYVALSRELCAALSCHGATVSQRGLGELNLSVHRAWDRAADNLLHAAQTDEGTRFLTRPAAHILGAGVPGLQIATPGAPATAWLAHPHTFTVLDRHLTHLLGEPVIYLAPGHETLLALPATAADPKSLQRWARHAVDTLGAASPVSGSPLVWRHGFPAVVG